MKECFLIDANLPFRVPAWQNEAFAFVVKINPGWNDDEIWDYAAKKALTIVTKDKDFLVKQAMTGSPPKVVHIKFGNLKLSEFVHRIEGVWPQVEKLLPANNIINIYHNQIEAIK
jgi:predicted nuclease of predicted toxin-antitoxin system